jgi:hypothetical protein
LATSVALRNPIDSKICLEVAGRQRAGFELITLLTIFAVLVHGYHPYAEDGGIYLAGIKRLLDPQLYPYWSGFVTAHLRFSLFAPMVAFVVRQSSVSLMTVMLLLYIASTCMTLFAGWHLAIRCYRSLEACYAAVSLMALSLTIPIAGTSLMMMDPYVSARSISTPCALFALVGMMDIRHELNQGDSVLSWKSIGLCAGTLLIAAMVHPLMAGYALACVSLYLCSSSSDRRARITGALGFLAAALLLAVCISHFALPQIHDYTLVARTRTYWFIDQWRWYEQFGLAAPIAILGLVAFQRRSGIPMNSVWLAQVGIVAGITGLIVALLFARATSPINPVARLQPLRIFQIVYALMILAIGATLGELVLKRSISRWVAIFLLLGATMFCVQRQTFRNSAHLEFPWKTQTNEWQQAFLWIKANTPRDAVFAMDADYVTEPGEDAQNFRAIAERSALPDYSKDGGVASIAPTLTPQWVMGETLERDLDHAMDEHRIATLRSAEVGWVVLSRSAATMFECDYMNRTVKVCRLPGNYPPTSTIAY